MIWENHIDRTPPESDWTGASSTVIFRARRTAAIWACVVRPWRTTWKCTFLKPFTWCGRPTGDDAWMRRHLDRALHAVHYSTSDPLSVVKRSMASSRRGLTIDTWDFLCDSEAALVGGDIMVIDLEKTHFGIFFGDNTGIDRRMPLLAEMLDRAQRGQDAGRNGASSPVSWKSG